MHMSTVRLRSPGGWQERKRRWNKAFRCDLCFDPMIYCSDWKKHYDAMFAQVCGTLDLEKLADVSVGTFRISQDYLKKMREK